VSDADDPVLELAKSESVETPDVEPVGKETVVLATVCAGIGAKVAGPVGAAVGGTIGWALDAVRRKLRAPG
jgi:hypothetical protein